MSDVELDRLRTVSLAAHEALGGLEQVVASLDGKIKEADDLAVRRITAALAAVLDAERAGALTA